MKAQSEPKPHYPRFIVCEDGREYLERFERFLGSEFEFVPAGDYQTLLSQLELHHPVSAVLLDLDFRRTPSLKLVDEHGRQLGNEGKESLATHIANQGLFILASLREQGISVQVVLFADIEDSQQCDYLKRTFAPLELIPSHWGMLELKHRLLELGGASSSK